MSNYDFESILKRYGNDPKAILKRYSYESGDGIFERINGSDESIDELKDIVNNIVLWKLNRMVFISDETLLALKNIQNINSPMIALNERKEEVRKLLISLLKSKGVRLAMASTFLHFFNPEVFPIIDQRAYRVVFKEDYKPSTVPSVNADAYLNYLEKCISYYNDNLNGNIPFSEIDKYLYQLDKMAGNRVKMYG